MGEKQICNMSSQPASTYVRIPGGQCLGVTQQAQHLGCRSVTRCPTLISTCSTSKPACTRPICKPPLVERILENPDKAKQYFALACTTVFFYDVMAKNHTAMAMGSSLILPKLILMAIKTGQFQKGFDKAKELFDKVFGTEFSKTAE